MGDEFPLRETFLQANGSSQRRYAITPQGTFHLTITELRILRTIELLAGRPVSRAELADHLGRNTKVVSRLISNLRREGVIVSEAVFGDDGAQLANRYHIAPGARPLREGEKPDASLARVQK